MNSFFLAFFCGTMLTVSIVSLIFTINSSYGLREYVQGYVYEQAYSTPDTSCKLPPQMVTINEHSLEHWNLETSSQNYNVNYIENYSGNYSQNYSGNHSENYISNDNITNCETLYRLPYAIDQSVCKWMSAFLCTPRFLQQSRVYIVIGITSMYSSRFSEFANPGVEHNSSDPNNWLFFNRKDNIIRVISSGTTCYGMSATDTNTCISDFISTPLFMNTVYCWGPWCKQSDDREGPGFASTFIGLILILSSFIFGCFFIGFSIGVCLDIVNCVKHCRNRRRNVNNEVYQSMMVDPI